MLEEVESSEQVQLCFRRSKSFRQWWQAVCVAAGEMGFVRLRLSFQGRDYPSRTLVWERNGEEADAPGPMMKIPIHGAKNNLKASIEVDLSLRDSLESAGRRVALLTRLLEHHKVPDPARLDWLMI